MSDNLNVKEFNDFLSKVTKFIAIPPDEKKRNMEIFDNISVFIIDKLKHSDKMFEWMCKGHRLAGSCADKLKISKANEFDLVIQLKIKNAVTLPDPEKHGYCQIKITETIEYLNNKVKKNEFEKEVISRLPHLANAEGFLYQDRVHKWIKELMSKMYHEYASNNELRINQQKFNVEYSTSGPAHNIKLIFKQVIISIDLVPAFLFNIEDSVVERKVNDEITNVIPTNDRIWIALPKPVSGVIENNLSFLTSFVEIERHFLNYKNNLKLTIKLMKKFRDTQNLYELKSYHIKTIFLWEIEKQKYKSDFWSKSPYKLLNHITSSACKYFENQELPFFWHTQQNMLGSLSDSSIRHILANLQNFKANLNENLQKTKELLLTPNEIIILEDGNIVQIATNNVVEEKVNDIFGQIWENLYKMVEPSTNWKWKLVTSLIPAAVSLLSREKSYQGTSSQGDTIIINQETNITNNLNHFHSNYFKNESNVNEPWDSYSFNNGASASSSKFENKNIDTEYDDDYITDF